MTATRHFFLFLLTLMALAGCKDPCKNVTCNQGGCIDGKCVCLDGYEGSACNKAIRDRWTGNYDVRDSCSSTTGAWYTSTFSNAGSDPRAFSLTPFYIGTSGIVLNGHVRVSNPDSADFSGTGNGLSFTGSASRNNLTGEIDMQFSVTGQGGSENCTAHFDVH